MEQDNNLGTECEAETCGKTKGHACSVHSQQVFLGLRAPQVTYRKITNAMHTARHYLPTAQNPKIGPWQATNLTSAHMPKNPAQIKPHHTPQGPAAGSSCGSGSAPEVSAAVATRLRRWHPCCCSFPAANCRLPKQDGGDAGTTPAWDVVNCCEAHRCLRLRARCSKQQGGALAPWIAGHTGF